MRALFTFFFLLSTVAVAEHAQPPVAAPPATKPKRPEAPKEALPSADEQLQQQMQQLLEALRRQAVERREGGFERPLLPPEQGSRTSDEEPPARPPFMSPAEIRSAEEKRIADILERGVNEDTVATLFAQNKIEPIAQRLLYLESRRTKEAEAEAKKLLAVLAKSIAEARAKREQHSGQNRGMLEMLELMQLRDLSQQFYSAYLESAFPWPTEVGPPKKRFIPDPQAGRWGHSDTPGRWETYTPKVRISPAKFTEAQKAQYEKAREGAQEFQNRILDALLPPKAK